MKLNIRTLFAASLVALMALPAVSHAQGTEGRQFDLDWAARREIRNIHKRLFLKESRFQFSLYSGVIPNNDFFTYFPLGARIDYYFSEDLAAEISGAYFIGTVRSKSTLKNKVEKDLQPAVAGVTVLLPQSLKWQAGVGTLWSPMHGKIGAFSSGLAHFDLGLAFGVLALGTDVLKEGEANAKPRGTPDIGGYVGATLQFYLSTLIAIRIDYRQFLYGARNADDKAGGLAYPLELSLGLSFFTPEPK